MGIIGAIVDCLECVISGAPYPSPSSWALLMRAAQRSLDFSRALRTAYVIFSVAGKLLCGFSAQFTVA
jgi:hypothetical protein